MHQHLTNAPVEHVKQSDGFVRFRQKALSNVEGLVIDVFDDDGRSVGMEIGRESKVRLSNASTNDVVILLDPRPFTLRWHEIHTEKTLYQFRNPISMRGVYTWPVKAVFLSANACWVGGESFATEANFDLPFPSLKDVDRETLITADSTLEVFSPECIRARIQSEGSISGTVELYCDMVYYVIGEIDRRHARLSRIFEVGVDDFKWQFQSGTESSGEEIGVTSNSVTVASENVK